MPLKLMAEYVQIWDKGRGQRQLMEMFKDYILLATGAAIGMIVAGVCGAAARGQGYSIMTKRETRSLRCSSSNSYH
jgi:hypothetical protein